MNQRTDDTKAAALAVNLLRSSRRGLMCGALGAGAAAVLTACGGSSDPGPYGPGDTGEPTSDAPTDEGDAGSDQAIAAVADVPVGGGLAVSGLLIVQPEEGEIVAYDGACPHQGTILPAPEDGTITCPSHGSQFQADDGALLNGPATTGLTEVSVTVDNGEIFRA